jgi:hypothetical protein
LRAKDALCTNETCVDQDQFKALVGAAGGAATAGSGETAGTSGGSPAGGETTDVTVSTAPPNDDLLADETIPVDEPEPADASALGEGVEASAEDARQSAQITTPEAPAAVPQNTPELAPANDNQPADPLPATGTE